MELEQHNPHWKEGFLYPFDKQRVLFPRLEKNLTNRQIIALYGLRRTGKTVLMKQLINLLIAKGIARTEILFFSFDEEQPKIKSLISAFEKSGQKPRYIFFDEIQKLENWQNQLKFYYDTTDIKFFVSGSSSLFIRKKVRESLAGRIFDYYLPPLDFKEYLLFRKKEELLSKPKLFPEEVKAEFELYLKRQFIETIGQDEEFIFDYVKSILEQVIYIDIPQVFPIANEGLLLKILKIIASNPGLIIEYESLGKEVGIDRNTLSNYLFYLEEAFLIKKVYHFSRNRLTSEKKLKRFYLNSTSFFSYLSSGTEESKIVENILAIETGAKFFWRTHSKDEVDFILEEEKNIIPLEVKYKESPRERELKPLAKFCREYGVKKGFMITKGAEEIIKVSWGGWEAKIELIPVWKYLIKE
ncbi:MAG TPA: ATP-binding protein [Candidatus Nanoarchaeia archaeon]|nr:ATP-binding protein [Candidatus Nanoarchaeia archaeon]